MKNTTATRLALAVALASAGAQAESQETKLDEVSVTATREERATAEVPQAIAVIGKETLTQKKMFNLKEALQEVPGVLIDSKNGGSDARLIVRGAGLKAAYGIREIMVLRDGVPMTDPDSFSKLDFLDTQDIERIEVAKGPGNLFAAGSSGGAIQIFSRSVFDRDANHLKIGFGGDKTQGHHLRYGWKAGADQALAVTASYRAMDNDWRAWNKFDTSQVSLKHGLALADGDLLESEIAYTESNIQLPGAMDRTLFDEFLASGRQTGTSEAWKHSGRYSKVGFFNTKLEMERGNFTFKPRLYYNTWYHYHPVTGAINETADWVWNLGTDLEGQYRHAGGTLVGGLTVRQERAPNSRKYEYGQVTTGFGGRIAATLSDAKGALAEVDDATTLLTGLYLQESWRPSDRWIVDIGGRYDVVRFDDKNNQLTRYNFATGTYVAGAGETTLRKTFHLPAPKVAASYKLNDTLHAFAMVAQAGQIPSGSEMSSNPALNAPVARNHEVGLKGRGAGWQMDASLYTGWVRDEIVQQSNGGVTSYLNAGRTQKKGLELSGSFQFARAWEAGGYYSQTDYTYAEFTEPVAGVNQDRSGKTLPFVPTRQYGVFAAWKAHGWRARLSANTWGEYWLDNANTEKYEGWEWVANLSVGYEWRNHSVTLNADNLLDKRYAFEVKKDAAGRVSYTPAAPRNVMLTYRYAFH